MDRKVSNGHPHAIDSGADVRQHQHHLTFTCGAVRSAVCTKPTADLRVRAASPVTPHEKLQPIQEHCESEPSLVALFTFVARHPLTQKSTQLNPLKPQTPKEKQLFAERQAVADARKAARNASASAQQEGDALLQKLMEACSLLLQSWKQR